jgi:hypothetical protein
MKKIRLTGRFQTDENGRIQPAKGIEIETENCGEANFLEHPDNFNWLKETVNTFRKGAGGETDG